MARIALVKCPDYSRAGVQEAVSRLFFIMGGADAYAAPGEKVLLKPNMLAADPPEKCVTTHPEVFGAIAREMQTSQARLFYGDSPIYGSTSRVARKTGLEAAALEWGVQILDFKESETVSFKQGTQGRAFPIACAVRDCDRIISICKLKTHGLTGMTGAVKNQFGCVSGINKGKFHVKLPEREDFAALLVDLNLCLKPVLYIMDAIIAMEGNGPRGGKPRRVGCLLASEDPVALDSLASILIGFEPEEIVTSRIGQARGLGTCKMEEIEVLGDEWRTLLIPDFARSEKSLAAAAAGHRGLRNALLARPVINQEICTSCGICILTCPLEPKALSRTDDEARPRHDYDRCIRCYCCQESCPEGAISLQTPVLGRFMNRFS